MGFYFTGFDGYCINRRFLGGRWGGAELILKTFIQRIFFGFGFHAAEAWEGVPSPATPPEIRLSSATFGGSLKAALVVGREKHPHEYKGMAPSIGIKTEQGEGDRMRGCGLCMS